MKRDKLFITPPKHKVEDRIIFAADGITQFNGELFVLADGVASLPHAAQAADLASRTAVWAYKVVRQRPFYWREKPELVKRIFRTANLTLWQKRKDPGFTNGLATALSVLIVSTNHFWVGTAGNTNAFLFRDGLIEELTPRDVDKEGMIVRAAGFARPQLVPHMRFEGLLENDVLVLASDGVVNYIDEDQLRGILEKTGTTDDTLSAALKEVMTVAKSNGTRRTMALCLVKRVVV